MFLEFRERCVSKATPKSKLTAGVRARGIKKAGWLCPRRGQHPHSSPCVRDVNSYQIIIRNSHARALTRTQFVRERVSIRSVNGISGAPSRTPVEREIAHSWLTFNSRARNKQFHRLLALSHGYDGYLNRATPYDKGYSPRE